MKFLAALLVAAAALHSGEVASVQPGARGADEKVIYEIVSRPSARVVLRAIEKHLDAGAGLPRIAVVAHGAGVESMLAGARDEGGVPYADSITRLAGRGVDFAVCGATLRQRHIDPKRVLGVGRIVDGGNAEIARLTGEGYVRLN